MSITTYNPANNKKIKSWDEHTDKQVTSTIEQAHEAHQQWKTTPFSHRSERMRRAAEILRERKQQYAELMTEEMGKPVGQSKGEVEKCAWVCDYYADYAGRFLTEENIATEASESFVTFNPLGVVLAVMPWNFPLWQVFRFAAPALMAGNAGLLKHAANVPGSANAIEEVFRDAGFPEPLFLNLIVSSKKVAGILEHDLVKAATLTGSERAGSAVAEKAGSELKKTVLELGGSDPYVILHDADIPKAAEICASSRLINSGQSCIAAKRFIAVDSVYDDFLEAFNAQMKKSELGDPMDEETKLGPQARGDLRDELHQQVEKSIKKGADPVLGCKLPDQEGAWYPSSVLAGVKPGMPAYDDELFGPVASVIRAKDENDAIRIANDSQFGLGSAVFTEDISRGRHIAAEHIEAGCCFVNDFVKSDPRLPFGGIKKSGYGRELSDYGIKEFVNIKTVYVK